MNTQNTITLNGIVSSDIEGLMIQTLPPITKPKMRTKIEEIDGRDGDIIYQLGYSAYDKEISIGLLGNYNVDDVISYFTENASGHIIFSNEPDKYYRYQIIDQIDFERLLRWKQAKVRFHVQPYKYSTEEMIGSVFPYFNDAEPSSHMGITASQSGNTVHVEGTGNPPIGNNVAFFFESDVVLHAIEGQSYDITIRTSGDSFGAGTITFSEIDVSMTLTNGESTTTFTASENIDVKLMALMLGKGITYDMDITISITDAIAGETNSINVTNSGNTTAKPVITVYGSGVVDLSLNGSQIFSINLGDTESYITIDTAEMNAYQGSALANRRVTGDYEAFTLQIGQNLIEWTGNVSFVTLSQYSRWI